MNLVWVQLAGVVATILVTVITVLGARSANRSKADVEHRTASFSEWEKTVTFQGEQLDRLRIDVLNLQQAHRECEQDKVVLHREIALLRGS